MHVLVIADQNDSSASLPSQNSSARTAASATEDRGAATSLGAATPSADYVFTAHKIAAAWKSNAAHATVQSMPLVDSPEKLPEVWEHHVDRLKNLSDTTLIVCNPAESQWTTRIAEQIVSAVHSGVSRLVIALPRYAYPDSGRGVLSALAPHVSEHAGEISPQELGDPEKYHTAIHHLATFLARIDVVITHSENIPLTGMHGMSGTAGLLGNLSLPESQVRERANSDLLHGLTSFGAPQDVRARAGIQLQLTDVVKAASYKDLARHDAAGNAGGLAFAFLAAGARALPLNLVLSGVFELPQAIAGSDLIVVKQKKLDGRTLAHSTLGIVTDLALKHAIPVIALTNEQIMSTRELAAAGVSSCYTYEEGELEALSKRLALSWTPNR